MARVLRLIELEGSPEWIARTLRMSFTHERSVQFPAGCFVTGTLLPSESLTEEVKETLCALKARAVEIPERNG
jgi:hypothetical protein